MKRSTVLFRLFWKGEKEHINITFKHLADTFIQIDFQWLQEQKRNEDI